jgi:rubrerythrin
MQHYQPPRPPMCREMLEDLREALVGELQAINQYEEDAAEATDPQVRALFMEIANDERHHVAELIAMINRFDPVQEREIRSRVCGAHMHYEVEDKG